tara:strand:- start:166 stop:585 length:420 start_codon:yes stop_codon:yes gene_type:complete
MSKRKKGKTKQVPLNAAGFERLDAVDGELEHRVGREYEVPGAIFQGISKAEKKKKFLVKVVGYEAEHDFDGTIAQGIQYQDEAGNTFWMDAKNSHDDEPGATVYYFVVVVIIPGGVFLKFLLPLSGMYDSGWWPHSTGG